MGKYHMNRSDREITEGAELTRILKNGKYLIIAMCRQNEPYIVTLSYGYDEADHALYFHAAPKGLKIDFINENPEVCATVIEDRGYRQGRCEHHYASVVLRGKFSIIQDLEEKKKAMAVLLNHLEDDPGPVIGRNLKDDQSYNSFIMLKLKITEMTGKKGK